MKLNINNIMAPAMALLLTASASLPAAARAVESTLPQIKVVGVDFRMTPDDMLRLDYAFDLSGITLGSNQRVVYTPVIVGEDGEMLPLEPVVVNGRNAAIKYEREKSQRIPGATTIRYNKKGDTFWSGSATVPYEEWMQLSHMEVREDLCGCGRLLEQDAMAYGPEFDNRPAPDMIMTFLPPVVEATKARSESGSAYVDYQVNKTNILPDYRNNRAEIAKIVKTIDLVKNDPLVSITEINIHGFASPEGSYAANAKLAEGRALSLKNYVKSLYTLSDRLFTSASTPEDWTGLRKLVEKSTLADKQAILAVIDGNLSPDEKDAALKNRFPASYAIMLRDMYPALRHSDYEVKYIVRPLTIEETIEVMKRNPKMASLQEMFLVAQTYEPGSDEFNEVMTIAVNTYPGDPTANLNAGIAALNSQDFEAARRYLAKAGDSGEAQQARGMLAMQDGDFDLAEKLLREAEAAGVADAPFNLTVLERARKLAANRR